LAQIYLKFFDDKTTPRAVRRALEKLGRQITGSGEDQKREVLDQAYQETMDRINMQQSSFQNLALKALSWITCAKRPLTGLELQYAVSIELGDSEIDEKNLERIERIVTVCAGLVTVDEESGIIRLVHYTTQEYLERTQKEWFPKAQSNITETCVTYLSFHVFESGLCRSYKEFEQRMASNKLFDYAAHNWGHHAREALTLVPGIISFLKCKEKVEASIQGLSGVKFRYSDGYDGFKKNMTDLHLTAYFGMKAATITLLNSGRTPDLKDDMGQTPLSRAAQNGHEAVVKLLLENKAEVDSKDNDGQTPLWWAACNGYEAVVKLLLENKAEVDSKDNDGQTPLWWAACNGNEAVVKLLLENKAKVDSKDNNGQTLLMWAASNGHEAVIKLLESFNSL
jgi:hypothetical protein